MSGLPPRHSFAKSPQTGKIAFQRVEHRKPLLPLSQSCSSAPETNMAFLGTFRRRLPSNLPLRAYAPFMVELFTPPDLLKYPSLVIGPAPTVTSRRLPTAAHVERGQWPRTPWEDLRSCDRSPALNMTALAWPQGPSTKVCLHRPPSKRTHKYRIERGDCSSGLQNQPVYFREPPSSTASDSHRTDALPAQHAMGG
jgi:hypothetical protein